MATSTDGFWLAPPNVARADELLDRREGVTFARMLTQIVPVTFALAGARAFRRAARRAIVEHGVPRPVYMGPRERHRRAARTCRHRVVVQAARLLQPDLGVRRDPVVRRSRPAGRSPSHQRPDRPRRDRRSRLPL